MAEQIVSQITMTIKVGTSFSHLITWKDAAGNPVAFPTGTSAEAKVRSTLQSTVVLARFATSPGASDGLITLTDPGDAELSMTEAQTALLQPITNAVFDIKYTFPGSPPTVVVKLDQGKGRVNIQLIVTRP